VRVSLGYLLIEFFNAGQRLLNVKDGGTFAHDLKPFYFKLFSLWRSMSIGQRSGGKGLILNKDSMGNALIQT
jgi:hypothetical protein